MRGGIQKKGNSYYAVVYDGIDPGTGKKRRRWVPAGTRRADAEMVLAAVIGRAHDGEPVPTEKLTARRSTSPSGGCRSRSRGCGPAPTTRYRRNIELHVLPALWSRPLDRLTPEDIDLFYATLLIRELEGPGHVVDGQGDPRRRRTRRVWRRRPCATST